MKIDSQQATVLHSRNLVLRTSIFCFIYIDFRRRKFTFWKLRQQFASSQNRKGLSKFVSLPNRFNSRHYIPYRKCNLPQHVSLITLYCSYFLVSIQLLDHCTPEYKAMIKARCRLSDVTLALGKPDFHGGRLRKQSKYSFKRDSNRHSILFMILSLECYIQQLYTLILILLYKKTHRTQLCNHFSCGMHSSSRIRGYLCMDVVRYGR